MKQYNDWEEIDKDTNGLVTSLTYMVLFVNDQVYNYTVSLMVSIHAPTRGATPSIGYPFKSTGEN